MTTRNKPKKNVGLKPGEFTMQVNFKDNVPGKKREFLKKMKRVQGMYRTRCYSQKEIAEAMGLPMSIVAKMIRCDPDAPKRGDMRQEMQRIKRGRR